MIENLIQATGLDLIVLRHDLYAAVNRWERTKNDREFHELTRDQLLLYLIIIGAKPSDEPWALIEQLLGETLPA